VNGNCASFAVWASFPATRCASAELVASTPRGRGAVRGEVRCEDVVDCVGLVAVATFAADGDGAEPLAVGGEDDGFVPPPPVDGPVLPEPTCTVPTELDELFPPPI
jgi:hypothetical protein